MKMNSPASPSTKGYFLSHLGESSHSNVGMRLLALAFDGLLITLLLLLVVLFVFGQTWLLFHASYSNTALYLVLAIVPLVYFVGFWSLLGATPGKLLLLPWLER
jgi:hypothetical protein